MDSPWRAWIAFIWILAMAVAILGDRERRRNLASAIRCWGFSALLVLSSLLGFLLADGWGVLVTVLMMGLAKCLYNHMRNIRRWDYEDRLAHRPEKNWYDEYLD